MSILQYNIFIRSWNYFCLPKLVDIFFDFALSLKKESWKFSLKGLLYVSNTTVKFPDESTIEIKQAKEDIHAIENGLSKPNHFIHRIYSSKGDIIRFPASRYEILYDYEIVDYLKADIANQIVKN